MQEQPTARWVIVGLGSPGSQHEGTRHNIGQAVVDALSGVAGLYQRVGTSLVRGAQLGDHVVVLAKPWCFLDRSGQAVLDLVEAVGTTESHVLVVYDDHDLPFGFLRIRSKGSAAGHAGMTSILRALGRSEVARIRVGVGVERAGVVQAPHLMQPLSVAETERLPAIARAVANAAELVVEGQVERAMSQFNRRDVPVDKVAVGAIELPLPEVRLPLPCTPR